MRPNTLRFGKRLAPECFAHPGTAFVACERTGAKYCPGCYPTIVVAKKEPRCPCSLCGGKPAPLSKARRSFPMSRTRAARVQPQLRGGS